MEINQSSEQSEPAGEPQYTDPEILRESHILESFDCGNQKRIFRYKQGVFHRFESHVEGRFEGRFEALFQFFSLN